MREISGDILEHLGERPVVITTNGKVWPDGTAVMGDGCAREAARRLPDLPARLGRLLMEKGNRVFDLGDGIVSFPVEESPWEVSSITLIRRSALELRELADRRGWHEVVLPPPGCGGAGLTVAEVRPVLESILDDRFLLLRQD
ncbi:MAG TPA: ADP-ribose-binding protein [Verrucomicrobiae bacterium]|nr:ADP-ribose-binding protein [Verrucomicrobiae bacterium]